MLLPLLVGLGVDELSVSPARVGAARRLVRGARSAAQAARVAARGARGATAADDGRARPAHVEAGD